VIIDRNLASRTAEQALAWMSKATFLYQLPLGLVSVAIATATLPTLARITNDPGNARFRRTLAGALRLVIVLILPAFVGLIVLGQDGIRLIFEHGAFTAFDTSLVTRALLFYLPGLPFAAIDQPLVFAFYARKDTVTPVLVGIAGVCAYLLVGPLLAFTFHFGMIGLVIANAVQLTAHCIMMWVLLQKRFGSMAGLGLASTTARALLASAVMGLAAVAALVLLSSVLPGGTIGKALLFAGAGGVAVVAYVASLYVLKVEELTTLTNMVRARLGRLGA
jgi:putative peptidoglycan lipid II flippase